MTKHFLLISISILILLSSNNITAISRKSYGNVLVDKITYVHDGDTFRCNISNYPSIIGKNMAVRISGIDTPELDSKKLNVRQIARNARQYTKNTLFKASKVELKNIKRGRYFRIVADVYVDGKSLGKDLRLKGLAKKYSGGRKPEW